MKIDLHGMSVEEAIAKVGTMLFTFDNSDSKELIIITGKGTGALISAIEDLLLNEHYDFEQSKNNQGQIIVYKKNGW